MEYIHVRMDEARPSGIDKKHTPKNNRPNIHKKVRSRDSSAAATWPVRFPAEDPPVTVAGCQRGGLWYVLLRILVLETIVNIAKNNSKRHPGITPGVTVR
jgi:hypothetical protein